MSLWQLLHDLLTDYTLRNVALGSAILGVVSGSLGTFTVLRRQALLGDAISHATLPGIALAFLLTFSKAPLVLLLGAAIAGWIATLLVMVVVGQTRIKDDAALGLVLSVFFGFGLVLLTFVQKLPVASQAGLDKFLFGQAATLMEQDVQAMAVLGVPALLIMLLFWKELKLLAFDADYGETQGFSMRWLDVLLMTLLVIAIVIGLQTVGVVLMSAMVIAPAAAARQWTDKLGTLVLLAALFGAFSGIAGALISSSAAHLPTGPTIVIVVSLVVAFSLAFAPNRGMVWSWVRMRRHRRELRYATVLGNMAMLAGQHDNPEHGHEFAAIQAMSGRIAIRSSLRELKERELVRFTEGEGWSLTKKGLERASKAEGGMQK